MKQGIQELIHSRRYAINSSIDSLSFSNGRYEENGKQKIQPTKGLTQEGYSTKIKLY